MSLVTLNSINALSFYVKEMETLLSKASHSDELVERIHHVDIDCPRASEFPTTSSTWKAYAICLKELAIT